MGCFVMLIYYTNETTKSAVISQNAANSRVTSSSDVVMGLLGTFPLPSTLPLVLNLETS